MKWTTEQIQQLSKKVYGNSSDEKLLQMVGELQAHLKRYEESLLAMHGRHEWEEVERLADVIAEKVHAYH